MQVSNAKYDGWIFSIFFRHCQIFTFLKQDWALMPVFNSEVSLIFDILSLNSFGKRKENYQWLCEWFCRKLSFCFPNNGSSKNVLLLEERPRIFL